MERMYTEVDMLNAITFGKGHGPWTIENFKEWLSLYKTDSTLPIERLQDAASKFADGYKFGTGVKVWEAANNGFKNGAQWYKEKQQPVDISPSISNMTDYICNNWDKHQMYALLKWIQGEYEIE